MFKPITKAKMREISFYMNPPSDDPHFDGSDMWVTAMDWVLYVPGVDKPNEPAILYPANKGDPDFENGIPIERDAFTDIYTGED